MSNPTHKADFAFKCLGKKCIVFSLTTIAPNPEKYRVTNYKTVVYAFLVLTTLSTEQTNTLPSYSISNKKQQKPVKSDKKSDNMKA